MNKYINKDGGGGGGGGGRVCVWVGGGGGGVTGVMSDWPVAEASTLPVSVSVQRCETHR